jgi:hypothetical protein
MRGGEQHVKQSLMIVFQASKEQRCSKRKPQSSLRVVRLSSSSELHHALLLHRRTLRAPRHARGVVDAK